MASSAKTKLRLPGSVLESLYLVVRQDWTKQATFNFGWMPPVFMRLRVEKRLFSALYSLVQMRVYPPYPIGAKEFRSVTILTFRHIYFTDSRKTIWRNCFAPGWITLPNTQQMILA